MIQLSSIRSELGEGPCYDASRKTLFWFDILGRRLHSVHIETGEASSVDLPIMASAMAIVDESHHLILAEDGLYLRNLDNHHFERISAIEADNDTTRSNDARVHPSGAFWVSTMAKDKAPDAGAIYYFFAGRLTQLFKNLTIPNAICFSEDGRKAHFTDTVKGTLMQVDCDPETGLPISAPRVFHDHRGGVGGLDGAVTDHQGRVVNARWGAGCVDIYDLTGARVHSIPAPASQPSCPVFFGENLERLAVTTAWEGMDMDARKQDPNAGFLFELDLSDVPFPMKGCPEASVKIR